MRLNIKIRFFLPIFILAMPLLQLSCQADVGAGPPAPDFSLQDLSGNDHSLPKYSGKVVLLDFWATWCPPCRMAIPELVSLQKKYADRGPPWMIRPWRPKPICGRLRTNSGSTIPSCAATVR
ncbi:MAG: TlpA family protein disulfide reductase [Deltaproteobacteria bacterium]|nr:TlpA family protein disulfide reductase [Deltaproteobacteria bacterium]